MVYSKALAPRTGDFADVISNNISAQSQNIVFIFYPGFIISCGVSFYNVIFT